MEEIRTWRLDSDRVSWSYRPMVRSDGRLIPLDLEALEVRQGWLQGLLGRLPALLGDFGYPTKVEADTLTKGDDTFVMDWRSPGGPAALMEFVGRTSDIWCMRVKVNLTCLGRHLEPIEIEYGSTLWINIRLTDSGALNVADEYPVYLRVSLHADIYAPITYEKVRDNRLLASLNGPRLASFLERVERDVPAELFEIYDDQYRGKLGPRGFKAPSGAPSDA